MNQVKPAINLYPVGSSFELWIRAEVIDHLEFFRIGHIGRVPWVFGRKADDVIGEFLSYVLKYAPRNVGGGHCLRVEAVPAHQFLHIGADLLAHIVANRQIKLQGEVGLLINKFIGMFSACVVGLIKNKHGKQDCEQSKWQKETCSQTFHGFSPKRSDIPDFSRQRTWARV